MPDENLTTPAQGGFTEEQKLYLQGFFAGAAARVVPFVGADAHGRLTHDPAQAPANLAAPPPEDKVFSTPLGDLSKPERWKYDENPLDIWEKLLAHAEADKFPDEADSFRFKFFGLFYVAPTQDSFMLRVRLPAGELNAAQLHGLAEIAEEWGGGYAHITTRANFQIREFRPRDIVKVLVRVQDLGLTSRGAGADNVRNITASPNSGFDRDELLDVRPYAKALHHYILNHRDLFGLPRKFNVAFDNGGSISAAADTNDIGFFACEVTEKSLAALETPPAGIAPGIYFRVQLGGVTGHGEFARDTGLLLQPGECVAAAAALIRVFNENGDRTNRKKARLKYLIEKWGVEKFLEEAQAKLAFPLTRLPLAGCEPRRILIKHGWLGVYRQAQPRLNYLGVGVPVGRLTAKQMHRIADLATNYGSGDLRLTVWQNLLIPNVPDAFVETVKRALYSLGLHTEPSCTTGGIIACTGNQGCKYSATDTKGHAVALAKALNDKPLDTGQPVNIHFTGCPNSCAQHYCGDIGLLGAKHSDGSEAYHVMLGGGLGDEQGLAREIFRGVRAEELNGLVKKILAVFVERREPGESFVHWTRRHEVRDLQEMLGN